jgi:uncharacterized membrane protein
MILTIILLRIIHIFCGVFWAGFGIFNIFFLQPTIRATGAEGQKIMQHLAQKTRFNNAVFTSATLTMLSGIGLYWIVSGFSYSFLSSGYGIVLTTSSIAGIIGWFIVFFILRNIFKKMAAIGAAIQDSGNPPSTEQNNQMQGYIMQVGKLGKVALTFILIALLGMSFARFASL